MGKKGVKSPGVWARSNRYESIKVQRQPEYMSSSISGQGAGGGNHDRIVRKEMGERY